MITDGIFEKVGVIPLLGPYFQKKDDKVYGCLVFALMVEKYGLEESIENWSNLTNEFKEYSIGWEHPNAIRETPEFKEAAALRLKYDSISPITRSVGFLREISQ